MELVPCGNIRICALSCKFETAQHTDFSPITSKDHGDPNSGQMLGIGDINLGIYGML